MMSAIRRFIRPGYRMTTYRVTGYAVTPPKSLSDLVVRVGYYAQHCTINHCRPKLPKIYRASFLRTSSETLQLRMTQIHDPIFLVLTVRQFSTAHT